MVYDGDEVAESTTSAPIFLPGRRSFGQFNKTVEQITQAAMVAVTTTALHQQAQRDTIDDEEMANRYSQYVGLPGNGRPIKKAKNHTQAPVHRQYAAVPPPSLGRLSASNADNDDLDALIKRRSADASPPASKPLFRKPADF